jgi:hypothetical protein
MNKKRLTKKQALKVWNDEICMRADKVDPCNNYVWEGIFIGLVIGLGGTPEQGHSWYSEAFLLEGELR